MTETGNGGDSRVQLVIGAIGHRDLVASEVPALEARVRQFLAALQNRYPDLRLTLLTSVADGADRLVGDVAQSLGVPVVYVLPMPSELYERDFDDESRREYRRILAGSDVLTLPLIGGNSADDVTHPGAARDLQYSQLGAFIAAHCHILLALWDGRENGASGGTAQIIRYHQDDYMPGLTDGEPRSRLDATDDESDLVYHVVCSRDRPDGQPAPPLAVGDAWWLSRDANAPRTAEMPSRYEIVLQRMVEFSRDVIRHRAAIERSTSRLVQDDATFQISAGDRAIETLFSTADWLSLHYRSMTLTAMRMLYIFAGLAGVCFIAYGDLNDMDVMIYPYLGFMAASFAVFFVASRGAWHRRYVDYRALAEALRVQFYWAIAGVERTAPSRFGHDAFLKRQDLELGWIRHVLRVAGRGDDANAQRADDAGIEAAVKSWIGDARQGQLAFFRRRWPQLLRLHRVTDTVGMASLGAGLLLAAWLALSRLWFEREPTNWAIALMGLLALVGAVRQAYAHRTAEHENLSQYQFMERVMTNALGQLQRTRDPADRRRILKELGDAALRENGQWILRQRERPISTPS